MIEKKVFSSGIELYPDDNLAHENLAGLLSGIGKIDFSFRVDDPSVNQGQMKSDFDDRFRQAILSHGASPNDFALPAEIPQELDFAFEYRSNIVAVEVEKTNREKILRDILKAHMYLHTGADFVLIALPKNYAHSGGIWNLYEWGKERFQECRTYGFGTEDRLGRIILLGFEQFDAETRKPIDVAWRTQFREMGKAAQS